MVLLVFRLDGARYALPLAAVERVVQAVTVSALPGAPPVVLGVIDLAGDVIPVCSIRRRLGLDEGDVHPAQQLVIARTSARQMALLVDEAHGIVARDASELASLDAAAPDLARYKGVARIDEELVLIHDLEMFLSTGESRALDAALGGQG